MHRDSKIIFENYTTGIQNRVTTNFGRSEVIDGFAQVILNLDKSEIVSLIQALGKMLPKEDLAVLIIGLNKNPKLKDKIEEVKAAGQMLRQYEKETETGRYSPQQLS